MKSIAASLLFMLALSSFSASQAYLNVELPSFLNPNTFKYESEWNNWVDKHSKSYKSMQEYHQRKQIFGQNMEFINRHNSLNKNYTLGMNHFGDLTHSEWSDKFLGYNFKYQKPSTNTHIFNENQPLQSTVDWRQKGAVTPVKNQGQCGSCWSFSATGSMEGAHYLSTNQLVSLSEQELVDCSSAEGDQGCFGGLMDNAFKFVIQNGGIDTEKDYQYFARTGSCNTKKEKKHAATFSSYQDVTHNSETQLAHAVQQQPVSVAIEADQPSFQFYKSGIFDTTCGTNLDHGVLAVGYGSQTDSTGNSMNYWIVKNSWGASWGNNGYILLAKDVSAPEGQCGIAMQASYPVV